MSRPGTPRDDPRGARPRAVGGERLGGVLGHVLGASSGGGRVEDAAVDPPAAQARPRSIPCQYNCGSPYFLSRYMLSRSFDWSKGKVSHGSPA